MATPQLIIPPQLIAAPQKATGLSFLAVWSLWRREVLRFLRQRSRIVGSLGTPIVFWLLIGSGVGRSFQPPGVSRSGPIYLEYAFPGMIVLILLFTAIFSTISIIEDRKAGFLQGVLVAPVGRSALVGGKILGSTTLAVGQGLLMLLLTPAVGIGLSLMSVVACLSAMIVVGIALSGLGLLIAWRMDSTQGFHAIMNLLLVPMWLLSGAFFPLDGAAGWLRPIMLLNPLTYGVALVRQTLYWNRVGMLSSFPSFFTAAVVSITFAIFMTTAANRTVHRN